MMPTVDPWTKRLASAAALLAIATATGHADAPLGRYTVTADTVVDTRTTLTWQRNVPSGTYAQQAAGTYCAELPLSGGGWRLPTILELQYLVDDTRVNPAIDPTAFPNTPLTEFWTSGAYAQPNQSYMGWAVRFADGEAAPYVNGSAFRVRCVR